MKENSNLLFYLDLESEKVDGEVREGKKETVIEKKMEREREFKIKALYFIIKNIFIFHKW